MDVEANFGQKEKTEKKGKNHRASSRHECKKQENQRNPRTKDRDREDIVTNVDFHDITLARPWHTVINDCAETLLSASRIIGTILTRLEIALNAHRAAHIDYCLAW